MEQKGNYPLLALSQSCVEAWICDYGLYPPDTLFYMDQVDSSNTVFLIIILAIIICNIL